MTTSWHSKAISNLHRNIDYIATKSPQNALQVLKTLTALSKSLAHILFNPKEPVYNSENVRFVTKWSVKIIYKVERDKIYILSVFNAYQKPNRIFE